MKIILEDLKIMVDILW